ncbi:regulator of chromosome condensation [Serratia phage BF]|uniref:Regulator of chromosome condensation (RCC1) repeat family protein n=1 Tax=Serratia phage BF TaxID=1962671 RepID=A0A1S6UBF9_9CAUD|nr:regulator of chromosome condensation [Serratia phage BF]AQW89070.1 regulator of chromosome condensation (RCC1) repeat family protein [Serratia phage BF]
MLPFPIISNLRQKSNYRIQKFIAGSSHIAVLGTNGQLYTRGNNQYGQLGDTTYSTDYNNWVLSMSNVSSIYGDRSENTIAIKNDGTVWVCGRFTSAVQFGFSSTVGANSWVEITSSIPFSVSLIKDIIVGYQMSAILRSDGLVYFCGTNSYGQFGRNNTTNLSVYTVSLATDVQKLYVQHPVGSVQNVISYLDSSSHIWACGYNGYKQVSFSNTSSFSTFQQMSTTIVCSAVAIAGRTSWYLDSSNNVGLFCGNAVDLQGSNSGILNLYSATGNQSSGLTDFQLASSGGVVYGRKSTGQFFAKILFGGGGSVTPLMNNVSNRANWLQQHTLPVSTATYSGMAMGNNNNAFLLYLGADYQEIWGLGLMFPQNDSVYRPLVIPDFN